MDLSHHDVRLGTLVGYRYTTPWAEAWLRADTPTIQRYLAIYSFRAWVDTSPDGLLDDEPDDLYIEEYRWRELDEAQLSAVMHRWETQLPNGTIRPINVYGFEGDGYITWRW